MVELWYSIGYKDDIRKGWLCKSSCRISNSLVDYRKKFCEMAFFCKICNAVFNHRTSRCLFCKKFCKVILFWCRVTSKRKVANGTDSIRMNLFLQIRVLVKQGLGHFFIVLSSSHFFNKTVDIKHYQYSINILLCFDISHSSVENKHQENNWEVIGLNGSYPVAQLATLERQLNW